MWSWKNGHAHQWRSTSNRSTRKIQVNLMPRVHNIEPKTLTTCNHFSFIHKVIDGITIIVNTVNVNFKSPAFTASVQVNCPATLNHNKTAIWICIRYVLDVTNTRRIENSKMATRRFACNPPEGTDKGISVDIQRTVLANGSHWGQFHTR